MHSGKGKREKGNKDNKEKLKPKSKSNVTCENCTKEGHTTENCWAKGGRKEGQWPNRRTSSKKDKKEDKKTKSATVADNEELFAFTCTPNYSAMAQTMEILKSRLGAIVDSGASHHFCPD